MKNLWIVLAYIPISILLVGCAHKGSMKQGSLDDDRMKQGSLDDDRMDEENEIDIVIESNEELLGPTYGEQDPAVLSVAAGANDFAFRLSAALAKQAGNNNLVCSPYSVWIPLAALANATDIQNENNLLTALGASGISKEETNNAAFRMLYDLSKQGLTQYMEGRQEAYYDPLKIANAIFVSNDVTLKKSFSKVFTDYYRGDAMKVDFSLEETVDEINEWASHNTEGLITDIVQKFAPNTVVAIASALYFSDRWEWEFSPDETKEDIFYTPIGESAGTGEVKAFYMKRDSDDQVYYEDDKVQAMPLDFATGGGMYIILPKDGDATGLLSTMTSAYFNEIKDNSIYTTGKLLLPRFSIESDVMELKDTLTALGVPLFDESAAPLTGGLIEESLPVFISSAVHKAVIEVDEKGTTAAAVTVMEADAGSAMPKPTDPFEMNCNKPFVFVLYGNTYDGGDQILFTGIVNRPQ
ncbi:hypothetical protein LQZ18_12320 [Lachnospiraceae bacterium ZAX-1]